MRYFIRLSALAVAFMLSREQVRLFDCNKMPLLSVMSGTLTLLLIYACCEILYRVAISDLSRDGKLAAGVKVALIGGAAVALAGFFTMMTHLCP